MTTRIAAVAALVLAATASPLSAQGRAPQQVVISPSVLKSITSQKPRSKTPMTARVGMTRAATPAIAGARNSGSPAATSVHAVRKPQAVR